LSEAVPGGIFGIRIRISGEIFGLPDVIVEELFIEGVLAAIFF